MNLSRLGIASTSDAHKTTFIIYLNYKVVGLEYELNNCTVLYKTHEFTPLCHLLPQHYLYI
jgi:hypothetical protein